MAGERIDGQVPFAGVDYNTKPARVSRSYASLWMLRSQWYILILSHPHENGKGPLTPACP